MSVGVVGVVRVGPRTTGALDPLTPLRGLPLVARAVRRLLASGAVDRVQVAAVAARVAEVRAAVSDSADPGTVAVAASVGSVGEGQILLVHDPVRALVPPSLVADVVAAVASGRPVAVPVLPLTDTVKEVDMDGVIVATPDRTGLRVVQTPQAFRVDLLGAASGAAVLAVPAERAYAAAGVAAHPVEGHPHAFAVRTDWDLRAAELLLAERVR